MAKGNKSAGGRGLNIKAKLDINEAKRNAQDLIKTLKDLNIESAKAGKSGNQSNNKTFDSKSITQYQQASLKLRAELNEKNKAWKDLLITEAKSKVISAEAKAEVDKLKIAEQDLTNKLRAGKVTADEYALSQKRINDAKKLAIMTQKESDRQVNQANKLLREQLTIARQEEAQREKNRKQLMRESSEYFQLNKALDAVRRRAKDVLAEMFNLERQGKKNTEAYKLLEQRSKALVSQTQILDNGVKRIDATLGLHQRHVGDYGRAIEGLSPQFASINAALAVFGTSLTQLSEQGGMAAFGTAIVSVGKNILKFLISPVGLAVSAIAALIALFQGNKQAVIDFDDNLLNVGKTTNLTGRNLLDLGNSVIALSRKLETVSASKLLEFATVAGQLGVRGKEDILSFAEALAKLEIATNIQGQEGGAEIARLLTLTDGGVQNVKAFGDEIVNLGNNFAASEKEILTNAEAISQNTGLYRIGRQEVLAYAVATKAVGLEADIVGSAFNRTLSTFEKAIRTGKNIELLAESTGLSVDNLKSKFKDNAAGVFNDFVKGLHNIDQTGGSVNGTLEGLGIVAVRDQRVLATLATSGYGVLNDALVKVKDATGSLATEFETASGKLKNQSAKFGIAWDNLVLSIENGQGVIGKSAGAVVGFFTSIVDSITPSNRSLTINTEAVSALTKRYDELTAKAASLGGKTKLTQAEQEELRKTTAQIGELIPSVITQFNQYGEALDINRGKINKLTKAQRDLLELQNRSAIAAAQQKFKEASSQIPQAEKNAIEANQSTGGIRSKINNFLYGGDLSAEEKQAAKDRITRLSATSYEAAKEIQKFGGILTKQQQDIVDHYEKVENVVKKTTKAVAENTEKTDNLRTIDDIKADIKRVTDLKKPLDTASKQYKIYKDQLVAFKKELKLANGGKDTSGASAANQYQSAMQSQRSLQQEIQALTKKGSDKQKSQDQQELADVDAKYIKLRQKAIKFNSDPKNKARGLQVDIGGLALAQSTESDALRDKQSSEKLKKSLDKEQDLFAAYEDAKTKIGKDKAAERYKDQIDTDRTYLESLEMQREAILNPQKSKGGEEVDTEANQLQLKVLNEAIEKEKSVQQKKYDDLLASLQTFEQESKALTQQYEADKADLTAKNDTKQLEQATKVYNQRLAELGDNHLKEMDAFKLLYAGIDDLSDQNARKVLGNAEDALKSLQTKGVVLSKELVAELNKLFKGTKAAIADRLPEKIISLANQIDSVAGAVSGVNAEFGKILSTLGNVIGQVGNIKKGMVDLKTANSKGDAFGAASAGLGIFGAGISILSSVVKLFDRSAQREEQAAYARDLQNKQTEALNKALERQIALLNDAYGTDRINKYSEAIKAAQENEAKYREQLSSRLQLTGNKQLDEQIQKFNNGEKQTGVFGKVFTDLLKQGAFSGLPTDIASLQKLLDEGKLDANTATIVENLIKANQSAKELANNLKAENVGSSIDEIADSFLSTLTDGTRDFGKSFEEVIRKSIINGFKQKLIEEQLQPFYNTFAELSKGGLTEDEIKTLQASYMGAADKAKQMAEDLKKATGIDITNPLKDKEGISGVITSAGLTEDTGNRAMGLWQGQYDQTKKIALSTGDIYRISVDNLTYVKQIAANTKRGADNTDGLGEKLDAIIANTDPDASGSTSLSQALRNSGIK
jgi:TP901 family phage tail tape measure protein